MWTWCINNSDGKGVPNSKIVGFDSHKPSIEWARRKAEKEGLQNITFEVANSTDYPGDDYDLVAFFDCFHDMGNLAEVARHVFQTLKKKDGTCMLVEPFANDEIGGQFKSAWKGILLCIFSRMCSCVFK